jgi:hypothetical protein
MVFSIGMWANFKLKFAYLVIRGIQVQNMIFLDYPIMRALDIK